VNLMQQPGLGPSWPPGHGVGSTPLGMPPQSETVHGAQVHGALPQSQFSFASNSAGATGDQQQLQLVQHQIAALQLQVTRDRTYGRARARTIVKAKAKVKAKTKAATTQEPVEANAAAQLGGAQEQANAPEGNLQSAVQASASCADRRPPASPTEATETGFESPPANGGAAGLAMAVPQQFQQPRGRQPRSPHLPAEYVYVSQDYVDTDPLRAHLPSAVDTSAIWPTEPNADTPLADRTSRYTDGLPKAAAFDGSPLSPLAAVPSPPATACLSSPNSLYSPFSCESSCMQMPLSSPRSALESAHYALGVAHERLRTSPPLYSAASMPVPITSPRVRNDQLPVLEDRLMRLRMDMRTALYAHKPARWAGTTTQWRPAWGW